MANVIRYARAIATNQFARYAPSLYVRATRQTGRGARESETPTEIASYFSRCVDEYFAELSLDDAAARQFIDDKVVLEYGPGDFPGVALLLIAYGARKVYCVDRFPLVALSDKNVAVVHQLQAALPNAAQRRLTGCFVQPGVPASGFRSDRVEYVVRRGGLSGLADTVDLVISRAVLEHVDDLPALFHDMVTAMRTGATAIHQVDLRSHGLHQSNPLDFLSLSQPLWDLLYSHKGVPNRHRIDRYRSIMRSLAVNVVKCEATTRADPGDVRDVRPQLAPEFRHLSDEDLAWLGFWLVFDKTGRGAAPA